MAIQNFLSGGFYGKLGDVVGQRWRNKRTIRTHVIPFNPRTELQQSNRAMFALATKLAQEAYNINKGDPLWDTTNMGQFSLMVGTAKRRLQRGLSPAEALPLFPDGHDPSVVLTNPSIAWHNIDFAFNLTVNPYTFTDTREMEIIVHCKNEWNKQTEFAKFFITIQAGNQFIFPYENNNIHSFPPGSTIQAVSLNDSQFGGRSISLPVFSFTQPRKPQIDIDIQFTSFVLQPQWGDGIMTLPDLPRFNLFEEEVKIWCKDKYGTQWGLNGHSFLGEDFAPLFIQIDGGGDWVYPAGSYIAPISLTHPTDTALFYFHSTRWDFKFP